MGTATRHRELLPQQAVEFRTDEMNTDEEFARVRVRRQLLPLMQTFNPKLVAGLAVQQNSCGRYRALDRGAARRLNCLLSRI